MRIGLQLLCGLVLIFALAAWFVLEIFVEEIKPGVRSATEDTLVDMAQMLAPGPGRHAGRKDGGMAGWPAPSPASTRVPSMRPDRWPPQAAGGVPHLCDRHKKAGWSTTRTGWIWAGLFALERRLPDPAWRMGARSTRSDPDDPASSVMHVAARCGKGDDHRLPHRRQAQQHPAAHDRGAANTSLKGAALLLFISLLIGACWCGGSTAPSASWCTADAISQGQPASLPRLYSPELDGSGHSWKPCAASWTARPISRPMSTA